MIVMSGEEIDGIVDPLELLFEIRDLYIRKPLIFERVSYEYEDKWIALMPGIDPEIGFVVKLIGIYPKATPRVRGFIMVSGLENGEIILIADASSATGWRTATTSALAAKLLLECDLMKRCSIDVLGIIGAGVQGEYHLRVFKNLFDIKKILIYDIESSKSHLLAKKYEGSETSLDDLLMRSDVIITATNSTQPVVRGDILRNGAIVISVGAPKPVKELDDITRRRAGCALVDTVTGVARESEDVSGIDLVEIGEYMRGRKCLFKEIKLYKSVGTSLLDIAVARHIIKRKRSRNHREIS
ncbi:MAG: hypothetical protein QXE13_06975 [Sulfolobales archaeon]